MNVHRRKMGYVGITHKIVTLVVTGIIGVGVVSFYMSHITMKDIMTQRVFESHQSTVDVMASRIDDVISRSTAVLVGLSLDNTIRNQISNIYSDEQMLIFEAMNSISRTLANYGYAIVYTPATFALLTADGRMLYNGETLKQPGEQVILDLYDRYDSHFQLLGVHNSPVKEFLIDPFQQGAADAFTFMTALPVKQLPEEFSAILVLSIENKHLLPLITAGDSEFHIRILTNAEQTVVLAEDAALIGKNISEIIGETVLPDGIGYEETADSYIFSRPLANYDGQLYDIMDKSYIDDAVYPVTIRLLFFHLLAVVILALAARTVSKSLTKRIIRLSERMASQTFSHSESDGTSARFDSIGDEIEILENSFDIMRDNIRTLLEQNTLKEQEKRKIEIKALQSQIRPHFLFNTLNTIRCSVQNNNAKKAHDMILALSGLLRMTLMKGEEMIPLAKELQTVQYYLDIMRMRSSLQFEIFYQIEDSLWEYRIPKLLLQPLVENCIAHGFQNKRTGGIITLSAVSEADGVHILVTDNGGALGSQTETGQRAHTDDLFSGIGITNVDRRIGLFFGEQYGISLYALDGYTVAEIHLPPLGRSE